MSYFLDVLFIVKKRSDCGPYSYGSASFGLSNSAQFVANALEGKGVKAKVLEAIDGNCIDRLVYEYKPKVVVIEAIWVTPDKLEEVVKLHPKVRFYVRIHSKGPFLAIEGVAFDWLRQIANFKYDYLTVSANNEEFNNELNKAAHIRSIYLPNIYQPNYKDKADKLVHEAGKFHIGCWGAVRPLKNTLETALGAILFAESYKSKLYFHVNSKGEGGGDNVLKSLEGLFRGTKHKLITHEWYSHKFFVNAIISRMDLTAQVSFSESYNIVAADSVSAGVPVVVSPEINWLPSWTYANPTSAEDIASRMTFVWRGTYVGLQKLNWGYLQRSNKRALCQWMKVLKNC